ncbi:MAG: glycosyltransferase family 4 protein [Patescibacteria group bacterium]
MKILYLQTFPLYGSGSGTYARELAIEVAKKDEVAMVAPENRKIPGVKIYEVNLPVKIAFTGHPEWPDCKLYTKVGGKELSANYLSYFEKTIKAVNDFQPNIIHVHHLMPLTWVARFVKIAYGLNFIVTVHGSELPTLENDKRYPFLTAEALHKAVRIIPNSFWTRDWMDRVLGDGYKDQIRVIPGGVDIDRFKKVDTKDIDQRFGLEGKKVVIFAGKLTPYKGVKYLVYAAKKIKGEVLILGDGSERKNLEKIVNDGQISNVRFLGHFGDDTNFLVKFYSRANVLVVPSVWDEPLGLVILEAMACETPVVVTRKGGIPLAVKDGKNGLFIKSRNANDIAEKVNYLLQNDEKCLKMGQKAREIAVTRFNWKIIAQKFIDKYEKFATYPKK